METVNNVVNAASKAIWGEQNTAQNETAGSEPVSGLQGKGTATEPFDQGNAENLAEPLGKLDVNDPTSEPTTSTPETNKSKVNNPQPTTSNPETPNQSIAPSKPETSLDPTNPTNAAAGGEPKPLENTEGTGVTGASAKYKPTGGDVIPSSASNNPGAPPASGATPTHKQQGADRPEDAPADDEAGAIKSKKDDAEEVLKKRDPNDHSGEPMHMHTANENKTPASQAERRESKLGNPGGQEHGKPDKGTGEQWVQSTGLHGDGGDFDATKPGAGKEADRLLEEKGIHKDDKGAMDHQPPSATGSDDKEKVSKMEKLKDKLHIGHKDK